MFKPLLLYGTIFILSLLPRFFALGTVPVSLSHDEVDLIIQAHSLRLTGTDLNQSWRLFDLLPNDAVMAELGPAINAPLLSLLPNSLFSAHATTALLGSLYPIVVLFLLRSLGWGRGVATLASLLLALSPWHILFSRTSLEQPTSLFFYTLSWLCLAKMFSRSLSLKSQFFYTFSFIACYALGFYTYHGFKFALPLITALITLYHYHLTRRKYPLLLTLSFLVFLFLRLFSYQSFYQSRSTELIFADPAPYTAAVNTERRLSLLPPTLTTLVSNKYLRFSATLVDKYLAALNPTLIFARGEPNGVFGTGRSGYLYLFLLPFVLLGLARLLLSHAARDRLLLLLLLLSPLATITHVNNSLAFRSAIYFVLLTVVASVGLVAFYQQYQLPKLKLLFALVLSLCFLQFGAIYFGFYPVESARAYFLGDRLLATYLSHRSQEKILVIDPQPRYLMSYLVLTSPHLTADSLAPLRSRYQVAEENNVFELGNLTIRRDCPPSLAPYDTVITDFTLDAGLTRCHPLASLTQNLSLRRGSLASPLDSGVLKHIYGEQICADTPPLAFVRVTRFADFALERLSRVQFCEKWVIH